MDLTADWKYIEEVAAERLQHNKTFRHVSRYGTEIEIIGAAGELAARRFLGLSEDLHTHFDGGTDIEWRNTTIDVKSTHLTKYIHHRFLQWRMGKPIRAQIILMTGVDTRRKQAAILGYAYKHEIESAEINYTRFNPCHEIPVPRLHAAWELLVPERKSWRSSSFVTA
jgi:hypothetical protein